MVSDMPCPLICWVKSCDVVRGCHMYHGSHTCTAAYSPIAGHGARDVRLHAEQEQAKLSEMRNAQDVQCVVRVWARCNVGHPYKANQGLVQLWQHTLGLRRVLCVKQTVCRVLSYTGCIHGILYLL